MKEIWSMLVVIGLVYLAVINGQAQRTVGPVQCLRDPTTNTLTATFVSKLNGDDINHVYGCMLDPNGADCTYTTCDFQTFTVGTDKYLTVESLIDISVTDPVADGNNVNGCGFVVVQGTTGRGYRFRIALRKEANFTWGIDNDYVFTCVEDQAVSTVVFTSIAVLHDNLTQNQPVVNPEVNMYVLRETATGYQRSSSCELGENMKLEIVMTQQNYQDFLLPWGLYARNTRVAPFANMNNANSLTDQNGCPLDPNVLELDGGFSYEPALSSRTNNGETVTSYFRSGVFQCKRYLRFSSDELHFDTAINFCLGQYEDDQNCIDFCAANGILRRRRQADTGDSSVQELHVSVTIIDNTQEKDSVQGGDKIDTNMIVIIAVCVGFCVLLLVAVLVFVCLRRRLSTLEDDDDDSQVSSGHKMPVH